MRSPLEDTQHETRLKDLAQIIIGAGTLALPVAMSTDTWEIAKGLSPGDIVAIACTSVLLIAGFVYAAYFRGHLREHWQHFLWRVLSIYGLTVIVSSVNLPPSVRERKCLCHEAESIRQRPLVA